MASLPLPDDEHDNDEMAAFLSALFGYLTSVSEETRGMILSAMVGEMARQNAPPGAAGRRRWLQQFTGHVVRVLDKVEATRRGTLQ